MSDTLSSERIEAQRKKRLRWYYRNKEKASALNKKWREENKERRKEANRLWREAHKEDPDYRAKRKAQYRRWKQKNLERVRASRQAYRAKNKERLRATSRAKHLKSKFGLTVAAYDSLLAEQQGCCALCAAVDPGPLRVFTVDHDHATGAIRGLLCFHCNAGLGHFRDRPDLLQAALNYLNRGRA